MKIIRHLLIAALFALQLNPALADGELAPTNITPRDCSGTIAASGAAQPLFAVSYNVHGFIVMNMSANAQYVSFTGVATAGNPGSYFLQGSTAAAQGGSFTAFWGFGINTAPSLWGTTIGDKYTCTFW